MMVTKNRTRIIRLGPGQMKKLDRLLDMEYTPAEIADETGISRETLYSLLLEGKTTARKGQNGRYWVHGLTFAKWARDQCSRPRKVGAHAPDEFFCVRCDVVRTIKTAPEVKHMKNYDYLKTTCPVCFGKVGKFAKREEKTA